MTVLWILGISAVAFVLAFRFYGRFLARQVGEDPSRPTPATTNADGKDYVPTPTPVVFAHHFASIAGAGPILGPVIAIVYGWLPALLWVVFGGMFIGAVHDYLSMYIATREGGQSLATIVRRLLGRGPFVGITIFLVVILALVCAAFLNASAIALTSMMPLDRLDLPATQTLFRVVSAAGKPDQVVIGGIASMSVICITAVAPLIGWLYLKRKVPVWICSILAVVICGVSITIGVFRPVALDPTLWKLLLSAYVLVAAGLPVWIFLQSRDFINVHILYVGMVALVTTVIVAGIRGAEMTGGIPATNLTEGGEVKGFLWPSMFILIACGAVSGFHSLCAGGTTCKQLTSETAARRIGYGGMLLESFLAVCVIAVMMIGAVKLNYLADVHPAFALKAYGPQVAAAGLVPGKANWVLGFAMAVGNAGRLAFGLPIAVGALAGMVLLEGFLVTTLDTAIRLTRYLIEEVWRTFFEKYDVFAAPVETPEGSADWAGGDAGPSGADGLPIAPSSDPQRLPGRPLPTRGAFRGFLTVLHHYWLNSGLAVALMLLFALTGAQGALWEIFATSNQLLAAMGLSVAALWLLKRRKRVWYTFLPGVAMLVTTAWNLADMLRRFGQDVSAHFHADVFPWGSMILLVADIVIVIITIYLVIAGIRAAVAMVKNNAAPEAQE